MDPYFQVEVISSMERPQQIVYAAMHQDYCADLVWKSRDQWPDESKCGQIAVRELLTGNKGHYGPLEHPQIVLNFGYFPHSTMQQVRTHRLLSFDVQSFRYTSANILAAAEGDLPVEQVVYLRSVGWYTNRTGKKYLYSEEDRNRDLDMALEECMAYADRLDRGMSEEHARGMMPFDVRQHWIMSCNIRSAMHLLDIRGKMDVQLETRQMTELMFIRFKEWVPEIAAWYEEKRWRKGVLAP